MRSTVTRVLTALLVVAAILTAVPARAGRPLDTEDTGTVPAGSAEVELGIEHTRDDDDLLWAARAGIGDAVLGAKYRLRDESEAAPAVLAAVAVRLPTGDADRGLGLPGADITMLAVVGKRWGPLTLHGNAGYTIVSADRGADAWRLAASAEWAAGARWTLVAELVSDIGAVDGRLNTVVRAGARVDLSDRITIDAAAGAGLTRSSPDLVTTLGPTLKF